MLNWVVVQYAAIVPEDSEWVNALWTIEYVIKTTRKRRGQEAINYRLRVNNIVPIYCAKEKGGGLGRDRSVIYPKQSFNPCTAVRVCVFRLLAL